MFGDIRIGSFTEFRSFRVGIISKTSFGGERGSPPSPLSRRPFRRQVVAPVIPVALGACTGDSVGGGELGAGVLPARRRGRDGGRRAENGPLSGDLALSPAI